MTTAADIIVASVQANPPGGDVAVSPAVRVLVAEIVRLRAAVTEISALYHRRGGTMKMCSYYPGGRCLRTECYIEGCNRAQEVLNGLDGDDNDE